MKLLSLNPKSWSARLCDSGEGTIAHSCWVPLDSSAWTLETDRNNEIGALAVVVHTSNLSTRQKQAELCESEPKLVY